MIIDIKNEHDLKTCQDALALYKRVVTDKIAFAASGVSTDCTAENKQVALLEESIAAYEAKQ